MKIYVLHECIDSNDYYAESIVRLVTKNLEEAQNTMKKLYFECLEGFDQDEISEDETWCEERSASCVGNTSNYFRRNWQIDEFEV